MDKGQNQFKSTEEVFQAMREIILRASDAELETLAREEGCDVRNLKKIGKEAVQSAIRQSKQAESKDDNIIILHKGLNSLLIMLRRRDNLDETELAQKADVDEDEVRRIEFDSSYLPSPRTIYKLEKAFSLPAGVLAKLSGAIKHQSPGLEQRVMSFAANAKSMGKLNRDERHLLDEFVKFLREQG